MSDADNVYDACSAIQHSYDDDQEWTNAITACGNSLLGYVIANDDANSAHEEQRRAENLKYSCLLYSQANLCKRDTGNQFCGGTGETIARWGDAAKNENNRWETGYSLSGSDKDKYSARSPKMVCAGTKDPNLRGCNVPKLTKPIADTTTGACCDVASVRAMAKYAKDADECNMIVMNSALLCDNRNHFPAHICTDDEIAKKCGWSTDQMSNVSGLGGYSPYTQCLALLPLKDGNEYDGGDKAAAKEDTEMEIIGASAGGGILLAGLGLLYGSKVNDAVAAAKSARERNNALRKQLLEQQNALSEQQDALRAQQNKQEDLQDFTRRQGQALSQTLAAQHENNARIRTSEGHRSGSTRTEVHRPGSVRTEVRVRSV